jgi:hypothetical protein
MNSKTNKRIIFFCIVIVIVLLIFVVGVTYAYFTTQGNTGTSQSIDLNTSTTDYFKLSISNELSLPAITQTIMAMDKESNPSASTTATATLIANNTTDAETQNYYMYLVASDNQFVYTSKDTSKPELLLKVEYDDGSDNYTEITNENLSNYDGVTLKDLSYKTVNSGSSRETSGWDITTATFVEIINNRAINAAKNSTTIDNFKLTLIFVNLSDTNQLENTGKSYNGEIKLQKEAIEESEN